VGREPGIGPTQLTYPKPILTTPIRPCRYFSLRCSSRADAHSLGCRYTQALDDPYGDDGMYGWLSCTLREGHRGQHHLAVRTEE
jgi:hypothetical protein